MPRAPGLEDWSMTGADGNIRINRAPVLTLWAAVIAERLGFDRATALTLGQAVAGHHRTTARAGGRAGRPAGRGRAELCVDLLGRVQRCARDRPSVVTA